MSLSLVDIDTDKWGGQISVSDLFHQLTEFLVFILQALWSVMPFFLSMVHKIRTHSEGGRKSQRKETRGVLKLPVTGVQERTSFSCQDTISSM